MDDAARQPPAIVWPVRPTQYRVDSFLGARLFLDHDPMLGMGARIGADPRRATAWTLDIMAERGFADRPVSALSVGGNVSGSRRFGDHVLRSGVGLRAGMAKVASDASSRSIPHAFIAPALTSNATWKSDRFVFEMGTEIGWAFTTKAARDPGFSGLYLGLTLGAGVYFE
jgi:hypothetical protein